MGDFLIDFSGEIWYNTGYENEIEILGGAGIAGGEVAFASWEFWSLGGGVSRGSVRTVVKINNVVCRNMI